jgi:hypothetical protein
MDLHPICGGKLPGYTENPNNNGESLTRIPQIKLFQANISWGALGKCQTAVGGKRQFIQRRRRLRCLVLI